MGHYDAPIEDAHLSLRSLERIGDHARNLARQLQSMSAAAWPADAEEPAVRGYSTARNSSLIEVFARVCASTRLTMTAQ